MNGKEIEEIRFKEASRVLLECSSKIKETVTPRKADFYEVLDLVGYYTDYGKGRISSAEDNIVQEIIQKLCSYMCKEGQTSEEAKTMLKELIVLGSKLYGNYIVNEPKPPQPKVLNESEENKNV